LRHQHRRSSWSRSATGWSWIKGVAITTGLVDSFSTSPLLKSVAAGQIDPTRFTTHRFPLHEATQAYDTFARPGETSALKVLLTTES
jgi:alcohol dehydrogenase